MTRDLPPKAPSRPEKVGLLRYIKLFRADILSAQPERLFRAQMAEFRTPFFRSYMSNASEIVDTVLKRRPDDFPKSDRVREGLAPLLGNSVFVTNGDIWKRQRRIIDPSFEGGRLRDTFPAMWSACRSAEARLAALAGQAIEVEKESSHAAADVIFRTLFSIPIEHAIAAAVFEEFNRYQRQQPLLNLAAFLPLPRWLPRFHRREVRESANKIRSLLKDLTLARGAEIAAGTAPDDLATKIMTTTDPITGKPFTISEMVDQVAIFFLAGHETSASALGWALYLLATHPDAQDRVAKEALDLPEDPAFSDLSRLKFTRDVFRETLRLYAPVPMMVRETTKPERFRNRDVPPGSQVVISSYHLGRHEKIWEEPDRFDPDRWSRPETRDAARAGYLPFSAGPRVCPGAGFAMAEGVLMLAALTRRHRFIADPSDIPVPVAHLTLRSRDGIRLRVESRADRLPY